MKDNLPLPQDKKLNVVCRIEADCLGPDGEDHIEEFCKIAQEEVEDLDADFVHWEMVPRHNKLESEMQYNVNKKKLTHDKAARYLTLFHKNLDDFEDHLHEKLTFLIDQYLRAKKTGII